MSDFISLIIGVMTLMSCDPAGLMLGEPSVEGRGGVLKNIDIEKIRSEYNVIYHNDFEDNTLGDYQYSDFVTDWYDGYSNRYETLDILAEKGNKYIRGYFNEGTLKGPYDMGWSWWYPLDIPGLETLYLSYDVRFKPGFEWVQGGKLLGFSSGEVEGGSLQDGTEGFSIMIMWKEDGNIVFYIYHQDRDILWGNTYYWNAQLESGVWNNLTIMIELNPPTEHTGVVRGYINGDLKFEKTDFNFRNSSDFYIKWFKYDGFFGGSGPEWAPTRNEYIDIDNIIIYN